MQAVIMAGGKGTRLASITKDIPKPMVPLEGRPLLEYQIENLRASGVTNIVLIIGHLGSVIKNHFGDGSRFGVSIRYYEEAMPLGTAGALAKIEDWLEPTFFLVFGDLFLSVSFDRFLKFHRQKKAQITLFAHPNSHPYDSDLLLTDDQGRVSGWLGKGDVRCGDYKNMVNAGLYVLEKEIVSAIRKTQTGKGTDLVDLEKEVIRPLIPKGRVFAYHSTEYVKDAGTPERLLSVSSDLKSGICEKRNLRHLQKCFFLDRDGTIVKHIPHLHKPGEVVLLPGAAEAIRRINASEYLAVVITNQPVIARGECTLEELRRIHDRLSTLLGNEGAYLDGIYFCPHHPDKGFAGEIPELKINCNCRKPKTGMVMQAVEDYHIDLSPSWFIGDTTRDVQTGINAGMRTALLRPGTPEKAPFPVTADIETDSLLNAVQQILALSQG